MKSQAESYRIPDEIASVGERMITSLSERDARKLASCFHPDIHFRALVPSGLRECRGSLNAVALMQSWFEEAERLQLLRKEVYSISNRLSVSYRFRELYSDGETEMIEQHAYCDLRNGVIESISIVCSGHLPEGTIEQSHHRYDAGDLGCGSGLPQEFRQQVSAIPIGHTIDILTRDPSAKEDLPSLARLLGHQVLSVQSSPEGVIIITVLRRR